MKTCYQPFQRTPIVYYTKDIDKYDLKSYSLVFYSNILDYIDTAKITHQARQLRYNHNDH